MDFAPLPTLEDTVLAQRVAQQQDQEAFSQLLERHLRLLRTYLALRAPMPELVDRVIVDVFLYVHEHIASFPGGDTLQPWLRNLALNRLQEHIDANKDQRMWQNHYVHHLRHELAKEGIQREDRNDASRLGECLAALPPHARKVLGLRYQHGYNSGQISAQTGYSEESIRRLLVRVRHQLKHCIESRAARETLL
jgi:RNA polymerase sigma-70 factor, ECF subfamily